MAKQERKAKRSVQKLNTVKTGGSKNMKPDNQRHHEDFNEILSSAVQLKKIQLKKNHG